MDTPAEAAEETLRALDVVALDTTGEVRVVRETLRVLGIRIEALNAAEPFGRVRVDGDHVGFIDEVSRRHHIEAIDPVRRRAVHRALASVMLERRHRHERAEHLAAAAVGPDHEASTALAALGDEASTRGDSDHSGRLFIRASTLTPDTEERARYLRRAGDAFWNAADYGAATEAFEAAYVGSDDPLLRADIMLQVAQIDLWQRGPVYARDRLVAEAALVEPFDDDRASLLLAHAANTAMMSSDIVGGLAVAKRASSLAGSGSGANELAASLVEAYLSLQHGDIAEFDKRFGQLTQVADALRDTDLPDVDMFLAVVGILHVYTERWDAGRVYLGAVAHRAKRRSHSTTAAQAIAILAEVCWRSGRWAEAWKLANSDVIAEVSLIGARLWLVAFSAHLDAGFGRAEECRRKAEEALAIGEPMGFGTVAMWANSALGLLELGLGHPVAAAAHLDRVDAFATAHEMVNPSCMWWQPDHIEALVHSGRRHEARQALIRFESGAALTSEVWPVATAARCRALLADPDDAEHWFEVALHHHARLTAPFELARTLLCRAERRIAMSSHLDPGPSLAEAIAIFDALGAATWAAHGRALQHSLAARVAPAIGDSLSPAERRVAEAVADGSTNREVAAQLYVSVKTVEFHLRNIFRKLGVRTRTELSRSVRG